MRSITLSAVAILVSSALCTADEPPVKFVPSNIKGTFVEQFTDSWKDRWTPSEATKKTPVGGETFSYTGKWEVEEPSTPIIEGDKGLVAKSKANHHAISAAFPESIDITTEPLVIQYEAKYQKGGNCGGGYLKLLEKDYQTYGEFDDKTSWVIMFGIDMTCPASKVHFIFRHKNPKTGEIEEKHLKSPPTPTVNKNTKLYTLVVYPNNTFEIDINGEVSKTGNLLEDFDPAVNPPKEIDDPEDFKPEDWVDTARVPDPEATKPADWDEDAPYEIPDTDATKPEGWLDDEPAMVPDPDAIKPEEWDDEEDGEWIPASIRNPKCDEAPGCGEWKRPNKANPDYKGKWFAPMIDNPAYKGVWKPRKIANPDFFEDLTPAKSLAPIGGVGLEIWTMTEDILFDNIYVGHSIADAKKLAQETFDIKAKIEEAESKAKEAVLDEVAPVTWKEDPVTFIRTQVIQFFEVAKEDPILAIKTQFNTAIAILAAFLTLFGMIGSLAGVIGSQKVVTKSTKKVDPPASEDKKKTEAAAVSSATSEKTDGSVKKRK